MELIGCFAGKNDADLTKFIDHIETIHPVAVYKFPYWRYLVEKSMNIGGGGRKHMSLKERLNIATSENYTEDELYLPVNNIMPFQKIFIGKMMHGEPEPFIFPATGEYDDISAAETATIVVNSWWREERCVQKWTRALLYATACGTVYFKTEYDKDGDVIFSLGNTKYREGNVRFSDKSPFMIFPDYTVTDAAEREWYIETYIVPLYKMERYVDKKTISKLRADGTEYSGINVDAMGFDGKYQHSNSDIESIPSCIVREFWQKGIDGVDNGFGDGNGRIFIRAGNTTIHDGPNILGELPYTQYSVSEAVGSAYGLGIVEPLIPGNEKLNRIDEIVIGNLDDLGKALFLSPSGSLIGYGSGDSIGDETGDVINYDQQLGPPHQLEIQAIPTNSLNYSDFTFNNMLRTVGTTVASFGELPTGSHGMSGVAFKGLVSSEGTRFSSDANNMKLVMESQISFALKLMKKFYTTRRVAYFVGETGIAKTILFKGSDLNLHADVRVEIKHSFGSTDEMEIDLALQLFDRGIIDKPDLIRYSKLFYSQLKDSSKSFYSAQMDLKLILQGRMPKVYQYSDHSASIAFFRDYLTGLDAKLLSDEAVLMINEYLGSHQKFLDEELQRRQAMMAAAQQRSANENNSGASGPPQSKPETQTQMDGRMGMSPGAPVK